jgi:two-component system, NarL family, nitrate/nitrite response regulator NarL
MTTKALVIDDHRLFAEAVRPSLERLGFEVSIVTTGREALLAVREEPPDLVLVDIALPGEDGLSVGEKILEDQPEVTLLALTALTDPDLVEESLRMGFSGYITKDAPMPHFVRAVLAALGGETVIPRDHAASTRRRRATPADHAELLTRQLTPREREVLSLLAGGAGGKEISKRLSITTNTVRTHVQSILTKLQVHSRLEAAAFAVGHGLVDRSDRAPRSA